MALDIQIPYKGSDYLFQGISGGANALASGAEAAIKKFKQKQDAGKAADYFMKAGGDEMFAQAGIHPEEWKTLGAEDKAAAVQAIMEQGTMKRLQAQVQEQQALAQERTQRVQLQQDEAEAFPRLMQHIMEQRAGKAGGGGGGVTGPGPEMAPGMELGDAAPAAPMPGPGAGTSTGTGGNFSPEEIMGGMAAMGKTSPRLAAALSRTLIPRMMEGATTGPQSYQSPGGNPYVWMGHTLMPDRPGFDPSALMGNVPAGYQVMPDGHGGMKVLPEKKPIDAPTQLPAAFWSRLDKLGQSYKDASRRAGFSDEEAKKYLPAAGKETAQSYRDRMAKERDAALGEIQQHLGTFESEGYGKPETWQLLKKKYGIGTADGGTKGTQGTKGTAPKVGEERGGYRFKGGNPADPKSWERIK